MEADETNAARDDVTGHGDELLALMNEIIEADPESDWAFLERAWHYIQKGREAEAVADLRHAADLPDENAAELERLATGFQRLSCWNEALWAFERRLKVNPNDFSAMNGLAWILATCPQEEMQDLQRAVALVTRAIERNPASGAFWNTLGVAHYRLGNWDASRDALMRSLSLIHDFKFADNGFFLAMVLHRLKDKNLAEKWYAAASRWAGQFAAGDEETARFGREAGALLAMPEPGAQFEANSKSPDPEIFTLMNAVVPAPWVLVKRAECHAALGDRIQALSDLAAAADLVGDDLSNRGTVLLMACRLADWKTVVRVSRDFSARQPEFWFPVSIRARAWMELGEWERALDDLADMGEITPDDNSIVATRVGLNLAAGNDDGYRRAYFHLLERCQRAPSPHDLPPLVETLLAVPPADFDAMPLAVFAERAAAVSPVNTRVLGAALYRCGQFAKAVEIFERGSRITALRARDHLFLAMAHHRLDQSEAALWHLGRATAREPAVDQADDHAGTHSTWLELATTERIRREAEALIQD
jgi:tetratricopeptide (TPR) repeat protein